MNKLRIRYQKKGPVRFVSQLEMVRVMERSLRRAGLPLVFSSGFSPRPRISFGPPTPVGFESLAEVADISLTSCLPEKVVERRLNRCLPEGFKIIKLAYVAESEPSLVKKISHSEFRVFFEASAAKQLEFLSKLRRHLENVKEVCWRDKVLTVERPADFPHFSIDISAEAVVLYLCLVCSEKKTIRPDALLSDFLIDLKQPLSSLKIERLEFLTSIGGQLRKIF